MRVNMKILERDVPTSLFRSMKVHILQADIQMTEEEKASIAQLRIENYTLLKLPVFHPHELKDLGVTERLIPVAAALGGHPLRLMYPDPVTAQDGMVELKQQLTNLKDMMTRTEISTEQSFEL